MTPKTPKNKKFKRFKMSCKEASNQKSSENKLQSELKNIKNDIFGNFKNSKITPKTPKNQKIKQLKMSCKEASNQKKFRKQAIN